MTSTGDDAPTVMTLDTVRVGTTNATAATHDWDADLRHVDRYLLLHRLGRGAFGVVRAAYDPELDRKVAIKLVRDSATGVEGSTPHHRRELLEEARMAAKLAHPNVVAIHDVGQLRGAALLDGIYIVMEHLGGPSLLDWLDAEPRGHAAILAVFVAAGRGLAAAHALGMVHRDFKPQNLRFGDDGRIRVLDFGLARIAAQLQPHGDTIAGTPAYLAPELHLGAGADARADQYAFCVALWRCLYGRVPHDGDTLDALANAKLERPSQPSSTTVPGWIAARLVRGLEPDPAARFPDMPALLHALGEDPLARRRRWFGGLALTAGLVAGGYGIATWSAQRDDPCALSPTHFAGIWDDDVRARVAASFQRLDAPYAEAALHDVERELGAYLEAWGSARGEVCRASLDRGERSIDDASVELECLDRQLRRVAAVSSSFQQADEAVVLHAAELVAHLPPSASCRRPTRTVDTRTGGPSAGGLALEERIAEADNLARIGEYAKSLALVDEVIAEAEASDDKTSLAHALLVACRAATNDRKYERARAAGFAAHGLALAIGDQEGAARALVLLMAIHRAEGNYDEADLLGQVAGGLVALGGPAVQVDLAFQLGVLAQERSRWDEAFARLADARAQAESLYGVDHLQVADIVLVQGITNSSSKRDFAAALEHFEHARAIYRAHYGELHPRVASTYNNIGGVYFRQDNWDGAVAEFEQSLAIYTACHGEDHSLTLRALSNLAAAEYQRGNSERAFELMERTLELRRAALGELNPEYINSEANFAIMLLEAGQPRRALPLAVHAHERSAEMHGAEGPEALEKAVVVATIAAALGDAATAARYGELVRAGLPRVPKDDPRFAGILESAADSARTAGELDEAMRLAQARLALAQEADDPVAATRGERGVAEVLVEQGRYADARALAQPALARFDGLAGVPPWKATGLLSLLARAEHALGDDDAAREHYGEIVRRLAGTDRHADELAKAHFALAELARDDATRKRHAQACITLLEPTGFLPEQLGRARTMVTPSR